MRLMNYDLTPKVYIFVAQRFAYATILGIIIGMSLVSAGITGYVVGLTTFFLGFFPDRGFEWISATINKSLHLQGGVSKEKRLAEIEGLSIWHQGRLRQEGLENVQNLATADVPALVITTPFHRQSNYRLD